MPNFEVCCKVLITYVHMATFRFDIYYLLKESDENLKKTISLFCSLQNECLFFSSRAAFSLYTTQYDCGTVPWPPPECASMHSGRNHEIFIPGFFGIHTLLYLHAE